MHGDIFRSFNNLIFFWAFWCSWIHFRTKGLTWSAGCLWWQPWLGDFLQGPGLKVPAQEGSITITTGGSALQLKLIGSHPRKFNFGGVAGHSAREGHHVDGPWGAKGRHHHDSKRLKHSPGVNIKDKIDFMDLCSGFVPFYGNIYNHMFGRAYGYDLLGHFNHFTNHYGPFGFWANFYHDWK